MEKCSFWLIYLKTSKKFTFLGPVTSINFLQFSQKCAKYIDPSSHFVFYDIFCSSNFKNSFFSSIVVKLNISIISKATILIFLANLPMVNIYKFHKKEILIQPPGEPKEQHLLEVRLKKFELHKIS